VLSGWLWLGVPLPRLGPRKIYVDEDPDLLARKMLALKQVELTHWVEHRMKTDPEVILERLEDQFIRAFCRPARAERAGTTASASSGQPGGSR
jgi:hypothetical protein